MKTTVTRTSLPPFEEFCEQIHPLWDSHILTNMGALHAKMSELQAAMGLCNLRHLAEEIARRKARSLAARVLCLPLYAGLDAGEVDRICDIVLTAARF